jgi:hypothetical protein
MCAVTIVAVTQPDTIARAPEACGNRRAAERHDGSPRRVPVPVPTWRACALVLFRHVRAGAAAKFAGKLTERPGLFVSSSLQSGLKLGSCRTERTVPHDAFRRGRFQRRQTKHTHTRRRGTGSSSISTSLSLS